MAAERNERTTRQGIGIGEDDRDLSRDMDRDQGSDVEASPGRVQAEPQTGQDLPPLEDDFSDPETQREINQHTHDM